MWKAGSFATSSGSSTQLELGLEDTTFNDVKFKLLSVEYRVKAFTSNVSPGDNNANAFNDEEFGAAGSIIVGVMNKTTSTTFNDLEDFQGTSAWPVHMTNFSTLIGNPASYSKTWKPRKVALSNEQNAFMTLRVDNSWPGVGDAAPVDGYGSIYIRGVRL